MHARVRRLAAALTAAMFFMGIPGRSWCVDPAAQANADALNALASGAVNSVSASSVVPNYTTTPPQSALSGQINLSAQTNATIAACATSTDPSCQGVLSAAGSAASPRPVVTAYDPAVAGVNQIAGNPGSVLGDLSGYYPGCTTSLVGGGAPIVKSKMCRQFATAGNLSCSKVLNTIPTGVASTCVPGTWVDVGLAVRGVGETMTVKAYCDPSNDSGLQQFQVQASGPSGACVAPQTFSLSMSGVPQFRVVADLSPLWDFACVSPFKVAVAPSAGCSEGNCTYTFKFGAPTIDTNGDIVDVTPWVVPVSFTQMTGHTTVTTDWDDQCSIVSSAPTCTRLSGPTCVDGPGVKTIGGLNIWASCWDYKSTYDCGGSTPDECAPLASAGCVEVGQVCKVPDASAPMGCAVWEKTYSCTEPAAPATTVSNCEAPCPLESRLVSPAVYQQQDCHEFLKRDEDLPCTKRLEVTVDWLCPADALSGPTRTVNAAGKGTWSCTVPDYLFAYQCSPPLTGPTGDQCTDPDTGATSPAPLLPVMEEYCPAPLVGPSAGMCTDPTSGATSGAGVRQAFVPKTIAATPSVTDKWINPCAGYEARVPPGLLAPDGKDLPVGATATGLGVVDLCERVASVCNGPSPEMRTINDLDVTRPCWGFDNQFSCLTTTVKTDCDSRPGGPPDGYQALEGDCALVSKACTDSNAFVVPPVCTAYTLTYNCKMADAVYESVPNCGGLSPADGDFARTVTYFEAAREAGRYIDPKTLHVFNGVVSECKKKYSGEAILVTNCCKKGGSGAGSLMDTATAANTLGTAYELFFSPYTFNVLFSSGAPQWVLTGFEAVAGFAGGASTTLGTSLSALAAGEMSLTSFMTSLGPWFWIILIIQLSGILDCDDNSLQTAMRRGAHLCVSRGEYCSRRLKITRVCVEKKESYCCFNSRLARIINEQGRPQVGKTWASCEGFSIEELQRLNFAAMDLTEFYKEIAPTIPDWSSAIPGVTAKVPSCYYGGGKC